MHQVTIRIQRAFSNLGRPIPLAVISSLLIVNSARADSPWENAVDVLKTAFTGAVGRGLSFSGLVGGRMDFGFGEGEFKAMPARHGFRVRHGVRSRRLHARFVS